MFRGKYTWLLWFCIAFSKRMFYTNAVICKTYHFIPLINYLYSPQKKPSASHLAFSISFIFFVLSPFIILKIIGKLLRNLAAGLLILVIDSLNTLHGFRIQKIQTMQGTLIHRVPL